MGGVGRTIHIVQDFFAHSRTKFWALVSMLQRSFRFSATLVQTDVMLREDGTVLFEIEASTSKSGRLQRKRRVVLGDG